MSDNMFLKIKSFSENESFARSVVGCFALKLNPNLAEISDIKTAVSEAVTNSIVHGYLNTIGDIEIECEIDNDALHINVCDKGVGIDDVDKAVEPFYSTKSNEERSGMGFTIMQSFMGEVKIESKKGFGTKVYMKKIIRKEK